MNFAQFFLHISIYFLHSAVGIFQLDLFSLLPLLH